MGVKKIMIFDVSVTDSIEQRSFHKAIEPFIDFGYVVIHDVPEFSGDFNGKEFSVNNFFLKKYRFEYDWVGFIGSDEFVVLHKEKCLTTFLKNYTQFGGVVLQWRMFSPIGVPYHDREKSHFEQYNYTWVDRYRHVKSIVQPKYVKTMHQHHGTYEENWAVNFRKDRVDGPFNVFINETEEFSVVELRHFLLQDMQFALFEKVCGLNDQRIKFRKARIGFLQREFQDKTGIRKVNSLHLPLIYNDLVELMFSNSDELIVKST
jgi:hypothetical protein